MLIMFAIFYILVVLITYALCRAAGRDERFRESEEFSKEKQ